MYNTQVNKEIQNRIMSTIIIIKPFEGVYTKHLKVDHLKVYSRALISWVYLATEPEL